jgi:hypothetical protein
MEAWQVIVAAVLGNAAVLAVLGFLAKALLEQLLQRDSRRFEVELKAKADSAIEQLKSDLQIRTIEHQVRFSQLHETRANVIAELNGLVVEALWEAESFLSPMQWAGEPDKREKERVAMSKLVELFRYFDKHRLYLPTELCDVVAKLVMDVRMHVIRFGTYLTLDESALQEHTRKEKHEVWMAGWDAIKNQVPTVRKQLEDSFRALLAADA